VVEGGTEVLDHVADTQFAQRGISVGDQVYVVTVGAIDAVAQRYRLYHQVTRLVAE
jgi:hypothetical protein